MSTPTVGGWIDGWCTSCRAVREHVIVAMVGVRPVKAECTSCHKQHAYRAAAPGEKAEKEAKPARASVGARATAASRKSAPEVSPAEQLDAKLVGRTPVPYDPRRRFAVGDAVRHPTFGTGAVTATPGPQKVEVLFAVGSKVLSHDRDAAVAPTIGRPALRGAGDGPLVSDAPARK